MNGAVPAASLQSSNVLGGSLRPSKKRKNHRRLGLNAEQPSDVGVAQYVTSLKQKRQKTTIYSKRSTIFSLMKTHQNVNQKLEQTS